VAGNLYVQSDIFSLHRAFKEEIYLLTEKNDKIWVQSDIFSLHRAFKEEIYLLTERNDKIWWLTGGRPTLSQTFDVLVLVLCVL